VDWHTVWDAIKPLLAELADDPDRLAGVDTAGVDEHIWHHQPRPGKGPKEQTGIVDLTRHNGKPRARLLDLVPGRSGKVYADWLRAHGEAFTAGVATATLDPFRGYGNAIRDELEDATAVLDAFHVVKLGLKGGDPDYEVMIAWRCYQQLRSAFHAPNLADGRAIALQVLESFPSCPIPEIARLAAEPCEPGGNSSWPTSPPAGPTTAAPKRSMASSNSTDGSPEASATPRTTDYG
jgi:transposase